MAIEIDGSAGEGGGQVLRTSLSLSLVTGRPLRIFDIRAKRRKPGLRRQHLTAVEAAAEVGDAHVEGAALGSAEVRFEPRRVRTGAFRFAVGTAGSATLVLQTVLPALMTAAEPSRLELEGGTHNPLAPPFEFVDRALLPLLNRMGPRIEARLVRRGFFPAGGGELGVSIEPAPTLRRLDLPERGEIRRRRVVACVSNLPAHIAEREIATLRERLDWAAECFEVEREREARGPGNVVTATIDSEHVGEVFCGFGERGVPAERVAEGVADRVLRYLEADVPVGPHLADQLLLPLALAGGGSFRTLAPTSHTTTNIETIGAFLDTPVGVRPDRGSSWRIDVGSDTVVDTGPRR
jgi:RNA 3'-terminal phosphate cyclase (ATP)